MAGLAISGGVDSIALAYLWRRRMKNSYQRYQGLIVDHSSWHGSFREAKETKAILDNRLAFRSSAYLLFCLCPFSHREQEMQHSQRYLHFNGHRVHSLCSCRISKVKLGASDMKLLG